MTSLKERRKFMQVRLVAPIEDAQCRMGNRPAMEPGPSSAMFYDVFSIIYTLPQPLFHPTPDCILRLWAKEVRRDAAHMAKRGRLANSLCRISIALSLHHAVW